MHHADLCNNNCQSKFEAFIASASHPHVIHLCTCNNNNYSYNKWSVSVLGERWVYLVALQSSKIHHVVTLFGHQGHQLNCFLQDRNHRAVMSIQHWTLQTEVYEMHRIYLGRSPTSNSLQSRPALVLYFKKSFKSQIKQRQEN